MGHYAPWAYNQIIANQANDTAAGTVGCCTATVAATSSAGDTPRPAIT